MSHIPKTFELVEVNGTLSFASYDEKILSKDNPTSVQTGKYYNDIWSYDISTSTHVRS